MKDIVLGPNPVIRVLTTLLQLLATYLGFDNSGNLDEFSKLATYLGFDNMLTVLISKPKPKMLTSGIKSVKHQTAMLLVPEENKLPSFL